MAGSQLTLDYLPDQNGRVVLVMTAADQTLTEVSDTVTITVDAVNDAPTFQPGASPITVNEDAGVQNVGQLGHEHAARPGDGDRRGHPGVGLRGRPC